MLRHLEHRYGLPLLSLFGNSRSKVVQEMRSLISRLESHSSEKDEYEDEIGAAGDGDCEGTSYCAG